MTMADRRADAILRKADEMLPSTTYPPYPPQPVTINGDRWAGQLVVKLADVMALLAWIVRNEPGGR